MSRTEQAREHLHEWIEQAQPDEHVASVAGLQAVADGLATSATVNVLNEAIRDGWIRSTRGPDGGYWRTEKNIAPDGDSLTGALAELADRLRSALWSIETVQEILHKEDTRSASA